MIRPYQTEDETALIQILKEPNGHYLSEEKLDFTGFQEVYVLEHEHQLIGFSAIEVHEKLSQIICYVSPSMRRNGFGTQLFEHGKKCLEALDPNTIWLFFRNDVGESASFYQKRGAAAWYSYHYMEAPQQAYKNMNALPFDEVIPYAESYFDTYLEKRADAFLTINQMIDSRPHDERDRRAEIKKWTENNLENIWLFLEKGLLVGSLTMYDGFFDELFVSKTHQNKGVGSAIVNWGLNRCFEKQFIPSLCVVTGNHAAINLYEKNGFIVKQTLEMNRLFSQNKEPDLRGPIGGA